MRGFARMIVTLMILALVAGSAINMAQATSMAVSMSAPAHSDGAMPGCKNCLGGDDGGTACAAACVTPVAAVLPTVLLVAATSIEAHAISPTQALVDHRVPPDPYPPRSTVLG